MKDFINNVVQPAVLFIKRWMNNHIIINTEPQKFVRWHILSIITDLLWRDYLLTYLLTYPMEQSPSWEANRFSALEEIFHILRNPKVHYRVYNSPPSVPVMSQMNPVHAPPSHFLMIHLNIRLLFTPGSFKWSLSFRLPHQNPAYKSPLSHTCYVTHPSHSSQFDNANNIRWGVRITQLLSMQFSPLSCYLVPLRPKYRVFQKDLNIFYSGRRGHRTWHPVIFSNGDTLKTMPTNHKLQDRIRAAVQIIDGNK